MAKKKLDGAKLYRACLERDQKAWRQVRTLARLEVLRILPMEADDIAQTVCFKLLRGALLTVREPEKFLGFIARCARNEAFTRIKKNSRFVSTETPLAGQDGDKITLGDVLGTQAEATEDQIAARLAILELWNAIGELPEYCARVMEVYFRYVLGQVESYEEMARILGENPSSVGVRIKRCLDGLRKHPSFRELLTRRKE